MISEQQMVMIDDPVFQWAATFLEERGCQLKASFLPVQILPWSSVYRVETSVGTIFLKHVAAPFAIEARLLIHLGCLMPDAVPEIVGHNDELSCFLMFDAGNPLRKQFSQQYQPELAKKALEIYSALQHAISEDVESLWSLGIPDWSLVELPNLFKAFLRETLFLEEEGLTKTEMDTLSHLQKKVSRLCHDLMHYKIPETIEHGDFQDNNILLQQNMLVINDWGDAVITHPFFSIIAFLQSAKRHHAMLIDPQCYQELMDSYLLTWVDTASLPHLQEAYALAERLNPIKFSLSFYRVAMCPGMHGLGEYHGRIAEALREFMANETRLS